MEWETLALDRKDHKATITLSRPEKLNAINVRMAQELKALLAGLNEDTTVRVVTLTGSGRGFSSGADMSGDEEEDSVDLLDPLHEVIRLMRSFRTPIIGAINGVAAGAGFSLAMACDIRIASEEARFSAIFVRRALSVDWTNWTASAGPPALDTESLTSPARAELDLMASLPPRSTTPLPDLRQRVEI
ncbi:MAG: enoyl-CoA hydratase/isomerase family protein, partial [Dehalococcoidia bacterium]